LREIGLKAIADWRCCLAAAPEEHKVYLSKPFQTDASMIAVWDAFWVIGRLYLRHGEIQ
jgi:hypothetical protein